MDCHAEVQTNLVEQQFKSALTPDEKSFILLHGNEDDTISKQATLLDGKKQYAAKQSINLVCQKTLELERSQQDLFNTLSKIKDRLSASVTNGCSDRKPGNDPKQLIDQVSNLTSSVGQILQVGSMRGNYGGG